jgi:elongation factor G
MHVEVIVDRLRERFGVEVTLKPPRVPYQETVRTAASAHARHKKQSGGRGQFGDCSIELEPLGLDALNDPQQPSFEFLDQTKGGVIPGSFVPAVEKGVREAMRAGVVGGYPVQGVRVRLVDGSHHSVDSSELAFKLAGAQAMRRALELADAVLLEPVMLVTLSVPEAHVGEVIGDLSGRRGRPQGMEAVGEMTEIRAEVPMAEMLSYAPDLRSITAGQGDYTLEFLRYETVPPQLCEKLLSRAPEVGAKSHA